MVKNVNVTISNDVHVILRRIKDYKGFNNNTEALEYIIRFVGKEILKNA
jgi:hypothetical protein